MINFDDLLAGSLGPPAVPTVATPTVSDLDFGSDLSCTDDLTSGFVELDADDPLVVSQAIYRRLTTPRDGLADDADYGWDVNALVRRAMSPSERASVAAQIRAEVQKDDRVTDVQVAITDADDGLVIDVRWVTVAGPFTLTIALTDAGALLKEMSR